MLVITLAGAEIAASAFYFLVVTSKFEAARAEAGHYYRASADAALAYELAPGFRLEREGRDLTINSLGLRGSEPAPSKTAMRFAVLGDSVTFGIGQDDARTIPRLMEAKLRRECETSVEVVNLAVPGYGARELSELLEVKAPRLMLDGVIYLMNLNDFARRDSIYEGADAGLYRMYHPPVLKLPYLLRKAVYRWMKGTQMDNMTPSLDWYRWMMGGTMRETLNDVGAMKLWANAHDISFAISILPSGIGLSGGTNALANEQRIVAEALRSQGIAVVDDVRPFLGSTDLFDETDHLTDRGNDVVSTQLVQTLKSALPEVSAKAGCRSGVMK